MITIAKEFTFDAAHHLPLTPDGHKCKRMHGHTYRVELRCNGPVRADGMVIDYADISIAWWPVHDLIDHRCLNDIAGLENPTTEILAPWLLAKLATALPCLVSVRVYESASTWCEATP